MGSNLRFPNRSAPVFETAVTSPSWAGRLKAMPGFGLPYDLIPSKDREFDPV
jgi:hypothetical protein